MATTGNDSLYGQDGGIDMIFGDAGNDTAWVDGGVRRRRVARPAVIVERMETDHRDREREFLTWNARNRGREGGYTFASALFA
jgi:Ca2+-binding RTX toxin-like protein